MRRIQKVFFVVADFSQNSPNFPRPCEKLKSNISKRFVGPITLLAQQDSCTRLGRLIISLGRLVALWVVQLAVPHKLNAGDKLLELEGDVEGEGDDVVVEHHPQQQHLQDTHKGDVVHLRVNM